MEGVSQRGKSIFLTKLYFPALGWWWFGLSKKSGSVYFFAILGVVRGKSTDEGRDVFSPSSSSGNELHEAEFSPLYIYFVLLYHKTFVGAVLRTIVLGTCLAFLSKVKIDKNGLVTI